MSRPREGTGPRGFSPAWVLAACLLSAAPGDAPAPAPGGGGEPPGPSSGNLPDRYDLSARATIPAGGGIRILFETDRDGGARFLDVDGRGAAVLGRIEGKVEKALAGSKGPAGDVPVEIQRRGPLLAARVGGIVLRAEDPIERGGGRVGSSVRGGAALSAIRVDESKPASFDEDFRDAPGGKPRLEAVSGGWEVEPSMEADLEANFHRLAARASRGDALSLRPADAPALASGVIRAAVRPTEGTSGAGIVFHAEGAKEYRLFRVAGGKAEIVRCREGSERVLATAKADLPRDAWTDLAVEIRGDAIRAFLDDTEVLSARDEGLFAGRAGLWASGPGPTWFDEFRAREFDPSLPADEAALEALRSARGADVPGDFDELRLPDGSRAFRHRLPFFGDAALEFSLEGAGRDAWWIEAGLLEGAKDSDPTPGGPPAGAGFRLEKAAQDPMVRLRIRSGAEIAAEGTIPASALSGARIRAEAGGGAVRLRLWGRDLLAAKAAFPASGRVSLRASLGAPGVSSIRAAGTGVATDACAGAPAGWRAQPGRIGVVSRPGDPAGESLWIDADPVAFAWFRRPIGGDFEAELVASPQTRVRFGRALRLPWVLHLSLAAAGKGPGSGYDFLFFGPDGPMEIWREGRLAASTTGPRETAASAPADVDRWVSAWRPVRIRRAGRAVGMEVEGVGSCSLEDAEPVPGGWLGAGTSGGLVRLSRLRVSAERLGPRAPPPIEWRPPAGAGDPRALAGAPTDPAAAPPRLAAPSLPKPLPALVVGGVRVPFKSFRSGPEGVAADGGAEGPVLELVERAGRPHDRAIRLRSDAPAGSMGATLFQGPIDPRRFPEIRLEYRIPPGVAADLFAVSGASSVRIPFADPEGGGAAAVADGTWRRIALPIPPTLRDRPAVWDRIVLADGGERANPAGAWLELDEAALAPRILCGAEGAKASLEVPPAEGAPAVSWIVGVRGDEEVDESPDGAGPLEIPLAPPGVRWARLRPIPKGDIVGPPSDIPFLVFAGTDDVDPPKVPHEAPVADGFPIFMTLTDSGSGVDPDSIAWTVDSRRWTAADGVVRYNPVTESAILDLRPAPWPYRGEDAAAVLEFADFAGNKGRWRGRIRFQADRTVPTAPFVAVKSPREAFREDCESPLGGARARHGNAFSRIEGGAATGRFFARLRLAPGPDAWAAIADGGLDAGAAPMFSFAYRLAKPAPFRIVARRAGRTLRIDPARGANEDAPSAGKAGFVADGRWHRFRIDLKAAIAEAEGRAPGDARIEILGFGAEDAAGAEIDLDDLSAGSFEGDSVSFAWSVPESPSGLLGYAFLLDRKPATVPRDFPAGEKPEASFRGLAPGRWWFHVRAVDGRGRGGETAHAAIDLRARPAAPAPAAGAAP